MENPKPIGPSRKKVVMVCEDESELLELYSKVLESRYEVIKVCSGNDCINKYLDQKSNGANIDLLILDYKLEDMLGDEVAKKIKEHNGIKIILLSAYNLDDPIKKDLLENKYIEKFLQKPIKMRQMIQEAMEIIC
ncbi:MAG: response regulator [Candidatus Nitrosocosmicus sp.]